MCWLSSWATSSDTSAQEKRGRPTAHCCLGHPHTHAQRSLRDFQESSGSTTGYIFSRACWEMWRAGRGKRQQFVNIRWMCCWCEESMMQNFPQERSHHSCTLSLENGHFCYFQSLVLTTENKSCVFHLILTRVEQLYTFTLQFKLPKGACIGKRMLHLWQVSLINQPQHCRLCSSQWSITSRAANHSHITPTKWERLLTAIHPLCKLI